MATIVKFSGYAVDPNGDYDAESVADFISSNDGFITHHIYTQDAEFEWDDDNPLNYDNPDLAECEKYFKSEPSRLLRYVEVGAIYRHFKGNFVKVIAVSQDTEHPVAWIVVYESPKTNPGTIWHSPYDKFVSEVDRKKYPDETQEYRFEKVSLRDVYHKLQKHEERV